MLRVAIAFLTLALSVASAKLYNVETTLPMVLAGTELKAGAYTLDLEGDKISVKQGKTAIQTSVRVETGTDKNRATSFRCEQVDGRYHVKEIRLGGTNLKLVLL
jgi:hypothetical protein